VSLRPQLVSFCLDRDSSSWPTRFADHAIWRPGPYGVPQLGGVLATLICAVVDRVLVGDHVIVLGRPVSAQHREGAPLLYHQGGYTGLTPQR
jgi:flavin reductase (DIM6/NTAB) family NADH-FMN oxidoreductase RutF